MGDNDGDITVTSNSIVLKSGDSVLWKWTNCTSPIEVASVGFDLVPLSSPFSTKGMAVSSGALYNTFTIPGQFYYLAYSIETNKRQFCLASVNEQVKDIKVKIHKHMGDLGTKLITANKGDIITAVIDDAITELPVVISSVAGAGDSAIEKVRRRNSSQELYVRTNSATAF